MNRSIASRYRGFMLVELVFVLGLIAVAAVISTQLYIEMTRGHARMLEQREAQERFDLALRPLRSDVWNSNAASVDEAGVLHLTRGDGKTIQWNAKDQLKRIVDGEPQRLWDQLGGPWSFAVRGSTVVLREEPSQSDPKGGQIAMPLVAGSFKGQTP